MQHSNDQGAESSAAVSKELVSQPWSMPREDLLDELGVDPEIGLTEAEIRDLRKRYGRNRLREAESVSAWRILAEQFKGVIVLLLAAAAGLSLAFGDWMDAIAITIVLIINGAIGFFTELRAVRSMEALRDLSTVEAKVRREGDIMTVEASELVPGDTLILSAGDVVSADAVATKASRLSADESALTGESAPVSKGTEAVSPDTPLAERTNMVFKGTSITRGSGEAVVVATGMNTELGRISDLVEEAEQEMTPLEDRLDKLGHRLAILTLGIGAVLAVVGVVLGRQMQVMVETSIALAVAAIPEGLPVVATIALARGMRAMARRNALVRRLSAVETLGATDIVLTDKTGTLTENEMTVARLRLADADWEAADDGFTATSDGDGASDRDAENLLRRSLEIAVLCNNASLASMDDGGSPDSDADPEHRDGERDETVGRSAVGDPTEVALLAAGAKLGISRKELLDRHPQVREVAFDPETKMMATFHRAGDHLLVAVKGAPGEVIDASETIATANGREPLTEELRQAWRKHNERLAADGLRVLALASKTTEDEGADAYGELSLVGLVGLLDPPRADVAPAVRQSMDAGVTVVMVTGDQPSTARHVASEVGMLGDETAEDGEAAVNVVVGSELGRADSWDQADKERLRAVRIFARTSPEQKLELIALHQDSGSIVAMTGDGVNDAPALKKADIGVAMGRRGTQVAREAADMVLEDDAFDTIVAAIEMGRVIFGNIRKFVVYLLSCNVSEIAAVALATVVNVPLPIQPIQILFLNLVTDVFPALALGAGKGSSEVMHRPPRDPGEPIMARAHWTAVGLYGALITTAVLAALLIADGVLGMSQEAAVTVSFLTLAWAQLLHVFNFRDRGSSPWSNDVTGNKYVWAALGLCSVLILAAVYLPVLSDVLRVENPGRTGWALIAVMSVLPLAAGQALHRRLSPF